MQAKHVIKVHCIIGECYSNDPQDNATAYRVHPIATSRSRRHTALLIDITASIHSPAAFHQRNYKRFFHASRTTLNC